MTKKHFPSCECGQVFEEACQVDELSDKDAVTVCYVPKQARGSVKAARVSPRNAAICLRVHRKCAPGLIEGEGPWAWIEGND